jgi:hypothetical protein
VVADTEEDGGSTLPARTIPALRGRSTSQRSGAHGDGPWPLRTCSRATSVGSLVRLPDVQLTPVSAPEASEARLGRSLSPLASGEGRFQVGSDLGHDLLGAADPRLPAALAAGAALAALGSGCRAAVTLCPATCLLTEMVTGHLRSVGNGRTYPLGKPVAKLPARVETCIRRSGLVRQVGCRPMSDVERFALGMTAEQAKHGPDRR